jgi:hypothetical protein
MLTIVRSRLCRQLFRGDLKLPPFHQNRMALSYQVIDSTRENRSQDFRAKDHGLILYTNVWPVSTDSKTPAIIARQMQINSAATAVTAGLGDAVTSIVYPRKSNVRFPAGMVGYVTLHPALLRSDTIHNCFAKSVSLTLFGQLAWDVTFPQMINVRHVHGKEKMARLTSEYNSAWQEFAATGMQIHGLAHPETVPYAGFNQAMRSEGHCQPESLWQAG